MAPRPNYTSMIPRDARQPRKAPMPTADSDSSSNESDSSLDEGEYGYLEQRKPFVKAASWPLSKAERDGLDRVSEPHPAKESMERPDFSIIFSIGFSIIFAGLCLREYVLRPLWSRVKHYCARVGKLLTHGWNVILAFITQGGWHHMLRFSAISTFCFLAVCAVAIAGFVAVRQVKIVYTNLNYFLAVTSKHDTSVPPILLTTANNTVSLDWLHTDLELRNGIPPRLYPEIHPPVSRIKSAIRRQKGAWHQDKARLYSKSNLLRELRTDISGWKTLLGTESSAEVQIRWRIQDNGEKLLWPPGKMRGNGFPRSSASFPKLEPLYNKRGKVIDWVAVTPLVIETEEWHTGVWQNDTLPHFDPEGDKWLQKECGHMRGLQMLWEAAFQSPSTQDALHDSEVASEMARWPRNWEELGSYTPTYKCSFRSIAQNTLRNLQAEYLPPRGVHPFYHGTWTWTCGPDCRNSTLYGHYYACAPWYDVIAWYVSAWGNFRDTATMLVKRSLAYLGIDIEKFAQALGVEPQLVRNSILGELFEPPTGKKMTAKATSFMELADDKKAHYFRQRWWDEATKGFEFGEAWYDQEVERRVLEDPFRE